TGSACQRSITWGAPRWPPKPPNARKRPGKPGALLGDTMLSREDNELLSRVGPGTPMGALMREYWIPAGLSSELPEPEGSPLRVRLLGEDLIAYRTASGAVGLIQNNCPHRGASLF